MKDKQFYEWGDPSSQDELKIPKARALAEAITAFQFASLLEVRHKDQSEGLIVEFQVELPQSPPVPILPRERIAIEIDPNDNIAPQVYALRKDFPETPHQNLTPPNQPKALCLFEEYYQDIRPSLTPQRFLQRIGDWLSRAAIEELHLSDQPLEPLLLTPCRIIFDPDVFTEQKQRQAIVGYTLSSNPLLLRTITLSDEVDVTKLQNPHLLLPIEAPSYHSRLISSLPFNLRLLSELFEKMKIVLEDAICSFVEDIHTQGEYQKLKLSRLIVILHLPKTRSKDGPIETSEWWAFLLDTTIEDLAIKVGFMGKEEGIVAKLVLPAPPDKEALEQITITPLKPIFALSKHFAQALSGISEHDLNIAVVGAGALGSQIILNLARQGFGTWQIIDYDYLLPHNLARHALVRYHEGANKAEAIVREVQVLLNDNSVATAFANNFVEEEDSEELSNVMKASDVILDFSTSHAVSRSLALKSSRANRISAFISPGGQYLVILAEGQERSVRLDDLEMQLAAAIAENQNFHDIYTIEGKPVIYAGSCRDVSVQLAQDSVALQAAIASQFIKANALSVEAKISLWEQSKTDFSVRHHCIPVYKVEVVNKNAWTIRMSTHAGDLMRFYRRRHLPNETGGVLLGKVDYEHRIVYIATILPSPSDSEEWPTSYVRGVRGLQRSVEKFRKVTHNDLVYVGEWHSHPVGHSNSPSGDDCKAHQWLVEQMRVEGLPGLMAIQGDEILPYFLIAS